MEDDETLGTLVRRAADGEERLLTLLFSDPPTPYATEPGGHGPTTP
jgi:hypothetical protein